MRVRQIAPFVAVLGILPVLYLLFPRAALDDGLGDFRSWTPTESDIARTVGPGGGTFNDPRHARFAHIYQQRFRDHLQAVGVKFISPSRIKAMFAPIIPRWDMARVATDVRDQARRVFGTTYDVDIYETYITAPMVKVGELRSAPASSRAEVNFDPRFAAASWEAYTRIAREHRTRRTHLDPYAGGMRPPIADSRVAEE